MALLFVLLTLGSVHAQLALNGQAMVVTPERDPFVLSDDGGFE